MDGGKFGEILGAILGSILLVATLPLLAFALGFLWGFIIKVSIGGVIVNTINSIFGFNRMTLDLLPPMTGLLIMLRSLLTASLNSNED